MYFYIHFNSLIDKNIQDVMLPPSELEQATAEYICGRVMDTNITTLY